MICNIIGIAHGMIRGKMLFKVNFKRGRVVLKTKQTYVQYIHERNHMLYPAPAFVDT